jgi:hypothetical protein
MLSPYALENMPDLWWHDQACIEYATTIPVRKGTATVQKPLGYRLWLRRDTMVTVPGTKVQGFSKQRPLETMELRLQMMLFCMLNPSIAAEAKRDPTDRKCNGFARLHGAKQYGIINPFALRSTNPKFLFEHGRDVAIGEHNRAFLRTALYEAALRNWPVIMAHGAGAGLNSAAQRQLAAMVRRIYLYGQKLGVEFYSLAVTADGHPRHPLMLGYNESELQPWSPKP